MAETRDVYMNHVQQLAFYAGARDLWVEAARRFGKTDGILGPRIWAAADSQPQGAGGFLGASRKQLFSRTIPGVIAALERFYQLKEGRESLSDEEREKLRKKYGLTDKELAQELEEINGVWQPVDDEEEKPDIFDENL